MSRRDNVARRCPVCRMFAEMCICGLVPRLETRTRLHLILHRDEARKPTNTGSLAARCLVGSEVWVRGGIEQIPQVFTPDPQRLAVVLYPADDAVPISNFRESPLPITLVVPDGTWRQAKKMRARVPGLAALPCVSLPGGPPTAYGLRAETHENGLATLEAIARAFGVLEGAHIQSAMEQVFTEMVARTRKLRGTFVTPAELRNK